MDLQYLFETYQQLIGVIIGMIGASVTSIITGRQAEKRSRRLANLEAKRAEYLDSLDTLGAVRDSFARFGSSVSGRESELAALTLEAFEESIERDKEGARSLVELSSRQTKLSHVINRLKIYGSEPIVLQCKAFEDRVDSYFLELVTDNEGCHFSGERFSSALDDLDEILDSLQKEIRRDLGIDQ